MYTGKRVGCCTLLEKHNESDGTRVRIYIIWMGSQLSDKDIMEYFPSRVERRKKNNVIPFKILIHFSLLHVCPEKAHASEISYLLLIFKKTDLCCSLNFCSYTRDTANQAHSMMGCSRTDLNVVKFYQSLFIEVFVGTSVQLRRRHKLDSRGPKCRWSSAQDD